MIKNTKLRNKGVKRAHELIYTAERQASRDVGLEAEAKARFVT
jgi:hypothetical protein